MKKTAIWLLIVVVIAVAILVIKQVYDQKAAEQAKIHTGGRFICWDTSEHDSRLITITIDVKRNAVDVDYERHVPSLAATAPRTGALTEVSDTAYLWKDRVGIIHRLNRVTLQLSGGPAASMQLPSALQCSAEEIE